MKNEPRTLMEAVRYFAHPDRALETAVALRWPNGVHCPTCGRTDVRFIKTRSLWECKEKHAKRQFSAKVGTIFEDSALPLDKWFVAIWAVANCKNGISSYELARSIGVTQKSAWHMLHRIRLAMESGNLMGGPPGSEYEADETFVGGVPGNMHAKRRKNYVMGNRGSLGNKTAVAGVLRRTTEDAPSQVHARPIKDANRKNLHKLVRENVEPGSRLLTDLFLGYRGLTEDFKHEVINHSVEYVRGTVHTNGIENFWSLLKRSLKGTYVSVDPMHIGRYVVEQAFRFNNRKDDDYGRFAAVLSSIVGKRLTYAELTDHGLSPVT